MKFLAVAVATLLVASAYGQTDQKRLVGSFDVDAKTTAPLQLVAQVRLLAEPGKVFKLLERYEAMPKWMPVLQEVNVDRSGSNGSSGVGCNRSCKLKNGMTVTESIVGFEPNNFIAYSLTRDNPMGLKGHLALATVEPHPEGGTLLTWRQYFDHPDSAQMNQMMSDMLLTGYDALLKGFGGEHVSTASGLQAARITQRIPISATPERVWSILGRDFGGLEKWASAIQTAELTKLANGGTQRHCQTSMGVVKESVTIYDEAAKELAYQVIDGLPSVVSTATNHWDVVSSGEGGSIVTMQLHLEMHPNTPASVAASVRDGLLGMTRGIGEELAYFANHGQPHPRKLASVSQ
ncbi:MAG: SRPBCC family protein [Planctomycetota bacterium]